MNSSASIRTAFLDFFAAHGHEIVPSSSLIPNNDPTLLFTNAGMVQFKDVFLGREHRDNARACSSQRCVRAGGKHNDLENVGYTARHHTFFEMLGNFSFGDYFKREAINYAWDFLTKRLSIPSDRLWVTVYDSDTEASNIWLKEIGVNPKRFSRIGDKVGGRKHESDNFWSMGDTGPCGPCSEIFYDHGPTVEGGPPGSATDDGDRYVEIWNLVFMQYNRDSDGNLHPLPHPAVDTGMGLERLAAVLQGVHNNYEIDLFQNLIQAAANITSTQDLTNNSLRVIADHIRSSAFLIADGVVPSNEGRGYVLRRIIRRAIRHGYQLQVQSAFFYRLVQPLVTQMGAAFPELTQTAATVERVLRTEEERFAETIDQGMRIFEQTVSGMNDKVIPGIAAFKLYDTYGFPLDLVSDLAKERGLIVDMDGFEQAMEEQRARARAASQFSAIQSQPIELEGQTDFTGYSNLTEEAATILALFSAGEATEVLEAGQTGIIILDRTPFYAESGGQAGDKGLLTMESSAFEVQDTKKQGNMVIGHLGKVTTGSFQVGDLVTASIDAKVRLNTALNHSATHLLHAALRTVLGGHVLQKGSSVDSERLRFDFAHFQPVTRDQLRAIEVLVNQEIRRNNFVETRIMSLEDAKTMGAMALFGEKYSSQVRVLCMGDFSTELCGGTHVNALGDIGLFRITSETGIASGVRRIEAVTGAKAIEVMESESDCLQRISELVHANNADSEHKVAQLLENIRSLEREVKQLKLKLASSASADLVSQAVTLGNDIKVLTHTFEDMDGKALRETLDTLKNRLIPAIIVLASIIDGKVNLVAGVSKELTGKVKAGDLIKLIAAKVDGKGGGRPEIAQGGGNNPAALPEALSMVVPWVQERCAN
ncbi:alanyl-tRNA synthetase [Achromatium sp. WMS2]|nr:alanyl-tRNA synthetase [Achromatium sp. WMS2]